MINLDLEFNFEFDDVETLTKRSKFDLRKAVNKIEGRCVPHKGESIRMLSPAGGFSSCAVVMAIAEEAEIKSLKMTTLRVGKKEAIELEKLNIPNVEIVCGGVALQNAEKYDYAKFINDLAERNGWKVGYNRNHSKVILCNTSKGKITIETSSNFNENPQIEQFCITNDKTVYNYYLRELRRCGVFKNEN